MSLFIGLMSGTSMDAVDAALVAFTGDKAQLLAFHQVRYKLKHEARCIIDEDTPLIFVSIPH
jgi:1,6-anhydro-N-acetylmuramate kinase